MNTFEITTHAPEATEALGEQLAARTPAGAVIALHGDLAAGKTCLTRGMARALAGETLVHSPTFTLVNEYGAENKLYHLDLYRLGSEEEILTLGYEDIVETDGICVIEWADRALHMLPQRRLDVYLEHAGGDRRAIRMENHDALPEGWQEALQSWRANRTEGDLS